MKGRAPLPVTEIAIAFVALAALAIAAFASGRQAQSTAKGFDTLSTYDAASGGYRAWYEMLSREGVRVEHFERRPAFLDHSVDVYVSASNLFDAVVQSQYGGSVDVMSAGDWDAVAKWVRGGGHLVWLSDGISQPAELNAPPIGHAGPTHDAAVTVAPFPLTDGVRSVSGASQLRVPFASAVGAAPLVADDTGAVVVSYPQGKGVVTIVTDETLFQNARLAQADNARLAYDLATGGLTAHGTVAFDEWSHGYAAGDSWWSILPRPFQAGLIVIAGALLLLVIGAAARFGPVARLPDAAERTSAEYLTSMALLYERGRAVRTALADLADGCIRDVAVALGLPESAAPRAIAARAGAGEDDARGEAIMELDRLRSYEYPHAADLVRAATLCAYLRKEFIGHGRIGIGRRASPARRSA